MKRPVHLLTAQGAALVAALASCAHVPPPSQAGLPSPWPEARGDAGAARGPAAAPHTPPAIQKTPGGAVIKPGSPPPVVPLVRQPADTPPSDTTDRTKAPPPGPPPQLNLPLPARRKLKNGTAVLVVERHALPIFSLVVVWPFGAADEPPGQAGLAGLTADMLDEGAGKLGALALAEEAQRLGARLATGATWDDTTVSVTALTRVLEPVLPLVADVVLHPTFDGKEVERVRADRLTTLVQQRDVPALVSQNTLARLVYGDGDRYGQPLVGTEATLGKLGAAEVKRWHAEWLRPELATIIVVGDVQADDVLRRLEESFATTAAKAGARPRHRRPPSPSPARKVAIVDRKGAAQTDLRLGLAGAARGDKDYFPCVVGNAILGGQFGSRLNMNLREKNGFTYGARSDFAFRRQGGPFVAGAAVKTAVTEPSLKETLGELDRFRGGEVSAAELRQAKDLLERALARDFETLPQVAAALVVQVVQGLPDDYYKTYADKIEAVSAAEVRRAARRFIDPQKLSIVLVGDETQIGPGVKTLLGAYERRGADGAPAGM